MSRGPGAVLARSVVLAFSWATALYAFIGFYLTCIVVTWWFYTRRQAEIRC